MSQNKTRIQGLDIEETPQFQQAPQQTPNSGFYSRSNRQVGTIISGVNDDNIASQTPPAPVFTPEHKGMSGKPVVGFLYSVSRTMAGEYWPLHIGSNTIGNNPDCDIVLGEGTVSGSHATLQVRRARNTGRVSAWVSDTMSTNGTMVNDTCLGSTPVDCKNGDIITVGDNYQLYLVLIDASLLGLNVNEDFIPLTRGTNSSATSMQDYSSDSAFDPWGAGADDYIPTDGTIGIDGSSSGNNKGGTRPI